MSNGTIRKALHWNLMLGVWLALSPSSNGQDSSAVQEQASRKKGSHFPAGKQMSGEKVAGEKQSSVVFSELAAQEALQPPPRIGKVKPRSESLRSLREHLRSSRTVSAVESTVTKSAAQANNLTALKSPAPMAM